MEAETMNLIKNIIAREAKIKSTSEELIKLWVEQGRDLVATGRSVRDLASLTKLSKSSIGRYQQIASNPTVLAYLAEGKSLIGYTQRELIALKPEVLISDAVYEVVDTMLDALNNNDLSKFDDIYKEDLLDGFKTKEDTYKFFELTEPLYEALETRKTKIMEAYKEEFGEDMFPDPKAELKAKIEAHEAELEVMKRELASA